MSLNNSNEMSKPVEFNYEPVDYSDVTIHFLNSAFHVHSLILKKESKVLGAALDGADHTCKLTVNCNKPGHRCFTVNPPFGTIAVRDRDMEDFFDHMYNPAALFDTPSRAVPIGADKKPILIGATVSSAREYQKWDGGKVMDFCLCSDEYMVDVLKDDVLYMTDPSDICQREAVTKSSDRFGIERFFIHAFTVINLCHYFDCTSFLVSFQNFIKALVIDDDVVKDPNEMFDILSLCADCHFDSAVQLVSHWLVENRAKFDVNEWIKLFKSLPDETSAAVMQVVFTHRCDNCSVSDAIPEATPWY